MPERFEPVPYSPDPTVSSGGGGGDMSSVRANPNDFGANIGGALEKAGGQLQETGVKSMDLATEFARQATESQVDNTLANQFTPAASKLRQNYDLMSPEQKLNGGHEQYLNSLQQLGDDTVSNIRGTYGQQLANSFILRHRTEEIQGVNKETVEAQKQFSAQSTGDILLAQKNTAINNWDNPDAANMAKSTINGKVTISGLDNGATPEQIDQTKRSINGEIAVGQIDRAADAGDHAAAAEIYHDNKVTIPGPQQITATNTIHDVNMLQFGRQAGDSLIAGQPIPPNGGAEVLDTKVKIANTAQSFNLDPNIALTVARIESNYGQNVGLRGTIGQDTLGGTKDEQVQHLVQNLQQAKNTADQVVGGNSTPDQQYLIYQQGAGGGAALLKASMNDPTSRAVDVVSQFYRDPKTALSAIQNNGGNATMTAKQFVDFISQKYNTNAKFAQCSIPTQQPGTEGNVARAAEDAQNNEFQGIIQKETGNPPSLGDALRDAHQATNVPPVQPAANPQDQLRNFDESYTSAVQQANKIPNTEERANVMKYLDGQRKVYEDAATSWKQSWQIKAEQLASSEDFTSTEQIPPSWKNNIPGDTLHYLQMRATYNSANSSGAATKDNKTYGDEFTDLFHNIHSPDGTPGKINDITQLQAKVGTGLTISGYDKLVNEMSSKKTPDGEAESDMKKQFFEMAKSQISGKDPALGIADPKGQEQYLKFMTKALSDYDKGKSDGKSAAQLLNPDSKDYIGSSIGLFKRPTSVWMNDMIQDNPDLVNATKKDDGNQYYKPEITVFTPPSIDTPSGLRAAYIKAQKDKDSVKMQQYVQEAIKRGYVRSDNKPQVPTGE